MKKDIAEKWVAALESGEYKQGKNYLNKDGKFCCLGVLCDLAIKDGVKLAISVDEGEGYVKYNGNGHVLEPEVQSWAGLKTSNCAMESTSLPILNDDGKSFKEIAKVIEKNIDNL